MIIKIQRSGNAQGLKNVSESANIAIGDDVQNLVGEEQAMIRMSAKPKFDLAEMVKRMPRDYQVQEESFGKPVGREEW